MYAFLDRLTPDDIAAITALAYVEMLETAYTRVGEFHYLHNDIDGRRHADPAATAASNVPAADESGIALTLPHVFSAHPDLLAAPPPPGQRRFTFVIACLARPLAPDRTRVQSGQQVAGR